MNEASDRLNDMRDKHKAMLAISPHGLSFDEIQEAYYSFFSPDAQAEFDWVQQRDIMRDRGEPQPPIDALINNGSYKWRRKEPVTPNGLRVKRLKL